LADWSTIAETVSDALSRLVPIRTIEALIYEGIGLAALLVSFHLIHQMIKLQVEEKWVRGVLNDVHGAFVIIYFVIFGLRLGRRFLFEGTNAPILVA
jgi:hypothetical protein